MKKTLYLIALCLCICSIANAQTDNVSRKRTTTTQKSNPGQNSNHKNDAHTPVKNSSPSKTGKVRSRSSSVSQPTGFVNGHEWVDLGLSVKWATMNVGSDVPEDYGYYFAWGETAQKGNYEWSEYKFCYATDNVDYTMFNKYITTSKFGIPDNKIVLELSDDAATINWGEGWRMPTIAEFEELIRKCTWKWTILNGIIGYRVTSKINRTSIFFPATGEVIGTSIFGTGESGRYYSSSLSRDTRNAFGLVLHETSVRTYSIARRIGHCVRAVCK